MKRTPYLLWPLVFLLLSSTSLAAQTPKVLMVGVYDDAKKAEVVHNDLKKMAGQKTIAIDAYAVVSKDKDGKVSISNTQQRDRRIGAVAGGILGLMIMGPAGAAVGGTLVGAGVGGLGGWLTGSAVGIPRSDINTIKDALQPNSSAIVAIVDQKWVGDLEKTLREQGIKSYVKSELKEQTAETAH